MSTLKSPRTIKFVLPLLALAMLTIALFSFTNSKPIDDNNYYFEYIPQSSTMPAESDYENDANWSRLAGFDVDNPEIPCPEGSDFVCVLRVPKTSIDTRAGSTLEEKLENHLIAQTSAATYVNASGNDISKKPLSNP
ncbi:MAG: hypothetical protein J7599_21740 [Niabella sp.]|nr:hypothetical protein [Niabella sp.]